MLEFELLMPRMGESIAEATIIRWLKEVGDKIEVDESVLEIATDKVDSEIPSPKSGILKKKLFSDGDVVAVNAPMAIIEIEGEDASPKATSPQVEIVQPVPTVPVVAVDTKSKESISTKESGGRFYSPLVLSIAKEENISMSQLENISGSGADGRLTKNDLMEYLKSRAKNVASKIDNISSGNEKSISATPNISKPQISISGEDEIIEMDRMRKLIADHMVMSKHTSPHVTSFVEADVTNMVLWRNKVKKEFEAKEGQKITYTPIFIECVVRALKDFPMVNVSVDGYKIIKKKAINIGMATALPSGNLIVPVIKNADMINLMGLTKTVNDLANRARANKLSPDEIQGGTFTITNLGSFGNTTGTPIINQPQVAILGTGSIIKKPAVLETEHGDVIAIRHMMFLSLSYDHRVVDGALGGKFIRKIADYMESLDFNRSI